MFTGCVIGLRQRPESLPGRLRFGGEPAMKSEFTAGVFTIIWGVAGVSGTALAEADSCTKANLVFSADSLATLVNEPDRVLAEGEAFWARTPAQQYTRLWAEAVGYEIDYEKWRDDVRSLQGLTEDDRQRHPLVQTASKIVDGQALFLGRALPHICSYLPQGANLDAAVYFTAFIPARSFLWEGIVINVNAPYWHGEPDNIFNNLVHEIWHVGYAKNRDLRTEDVNVDETRFDMLDALQNEGTATYVGYRASNIFPAPDEKDYPLLENAQEVERLLAEVNHLFAQAGVLPSAELERLVWEKGVIGRAFYIVGGFMAETIECTLGRQALVATVRAGPITFADSYNSLVEVGLRLNYQPTVKQRPVRLPERRGDFQ
jgi:hypothetical protein